jgi:hypothetical protein
MGRHGHMIWYLGGLTPVPSGETIGVIRCITGLKPFSIGGLRIMSNPNQSIVTFKADASLVEALRAVPNRSAFIRHAVLAALENQCPLCAGTGILSPEQKRHWSNFAADHTIAECGKCHEWHLVCSHRKTPDPHAVDDGGDA